MIITRSFLSFIGAENLSSSNHSEEDSLITLFSSPPFQLNFYCDFPGLNVQLHSIRQLRAYEHSGDLSMCQLKDDCHSRIRCKPSRLYSRGTITRILCPQTPPQVRYPISIWLTPKMNIEDNK